MTEDVVVIGSGFGGSISANRLALAGRKVLVLERGPWRDSLPVRSMGIPKRAPFPYGMTFVTHFLRTIHVGRGAEPTHPLHKKGLIELLRRAVLQVLRVSGAGSAQGLTLNKSGMFEVFSFPGLNVLVVSAVGGGSHGWAGMVVEPQDPAYWRGRHPDLNPAQVEKYYDKVRADLGAVRISKEHFLPHSIWTHRPTSSTGRCLPSDPQPYIAMRLPYSESEVGQETEDAGGVKRRTCAFDGDSFLGSRGGAKASVDFVYLAPALNKGATVRDLCEVTKIVRHGTGGDNEYAVHFSDLHKRTKEIVRAKRVILAAGTMNTLRLLFASSRESGGLSPMLSLGLTFGGNGDLFGAWHKTSAQPAMFVSPPVLGRFTVAGEDVPFVGLGGLPGIDTLPLLFARKTLAKMVPIIGMGADSGKAAVRFNKGRLDVDYDPALEPIFERIRETIRALQADSGLKAWAITKPITIHPWGGACLGAGPDRGVVDHNGEVYGNPGLFVADGSVLPAAVGTPPSLTIAAWAHHVADSLAQRAS
ncbi:MAG TPA: GMC oxidoreductase [Gemmataceae bacterium]|jgi:cholesterol oxidase|nr:GMC oxidoreductase [Gemmataceae bacterium]